MSTAQPIAGFERLLAALERDLLEATDEEILAIANELGMKPGMKGSIALFGVTFAARLKQDTKSKRRSRIATDSVSAPRSRRRPKGDASSST